MLLLLLACPPASFLHTVACRASSPVVALHHKSCPGFGLRFKQIMHPGRSRARDRLHPFVSAAAPAAAGRVLFIVSVGSVVPTVRD